ncbi:MAG: DUF3078 domain-containing protein [Bacteroidales bacterium]|nr:DUF3078 domain-containing protein [Bacteroidales bacterium]
MNFRFLFFLTIFFLSSILIQAQENTQDTITNWKIGGTGSLTFSQVSFQNWTAGGENSYSLSGFLSLHANYKKDRVSWENALDMGYGIVRQAGRGVRKSDDRFEVMSKYGYKTSSDWYYSGSFNFSTQFDKGYKYNEEEGTKQEISDFMAPAYALLSIGMDYKPSDAFSLVLSPLTGKTTFVLDDLLSSRGAFGVKEGENIRNEFGGYVKISYNQDIWEDVTLNTKLDLFSNYLKEPQNVDINWEVLISMKVNEYLSANLNTRLIYDDNINYVNEKGEVLGPRIQFKEVFGAGLSYKF